MATARRFFREEQDAADAVQDAFLSAFKAIATFNGDSQLGTWLHRIVVNACLMRRRSQDRRPTVAIGSLLPEFDAMDHHRESVKSFRALPNDVLAIEELRQQVRDCIHRFARSLPRSADPARHRRIRYRSDRRSIGCIARSCKDSPAPSTTGSSDLVRANSATSAGLMALLTFRLLAAIRKSLNRSAEFRPRRPLILDCVPLLRRRSTECKSQLLAVLHVRKSGRPAMDIS